MEETQEKIIPQVIEDEMKRAYLDYAMSVIVQRALPDARDGLKPVHRRILYAMNDMGMKYTSSFKKCARIVGEVLGKYHPHGDQAVYDSLVRMAQDFSLRYPLISGQGNFGSLDGDNAAAMRYTEAKLSKISDEVLSEIGQDTVDFTDNFDGSLKEPRVLPSKIPNLLINGASGIAVGMATNIPPHNLSEVCSAVIRFIDNPEITVLELMQIVKGPDFPTGAIITGSSGIVQAYSYGRGKVRVRSVIQTEEKKGKRHLIITEIPYMVNKSQLVEEIADRIREKRIEGISDLRDESDKDGVRVVLELKTNANEEVSRNQLLKCTRAEETFSINLLSLVDNQPRVLSLKQMISEFVLFRQQVVTRRTNFELNKAEARTHIIEGIIVCLDNIDAVVELLKKSRTAELAKASLIELYSLSDKQSQAILEMKLQRLTALEQEKLRSEHKDLLQRIAELKAILGSEQKILEIIKDEMKDIISKYGDNRRTQIEEGEDIDLDIEDLIVEEEQVVTFSNQGYIKRLSKDTYKVQKRGGKGKIGTIHDDDDFIERVFIANTHSYLLCFSNTGQVYWLKVYRIPESGRYSKGKAIVNLVELSRGEKITSVIPVRQFREDQYLIMVTKKGIIKKTELSAYSRPRHGGIRAINIMPEDELISVALGDETKNILIATSAGRAVKFSESSIRPIGRTGKGVRGIKVAGNDEVIGMVLATDEEKLLTLTENGYGKKTEISEYRLINRGGSGVRNIICSPRNGRVVSIKAVEESDELILMSKHGIALRIAGSSISTIGRNTQGMRLMKLVSGDKAVSAAHIIVNEDSEVDNALS